MDALSVGLRNRLDARTDLLPEGSHVLVAFSGGPDSTALLHTLLELRDERRFRLSAACFDHGLRPGSEQEAARSAHRCEALGIPCFVGRAPPGIPRTHAAMRTARYEFLRSTARRIGATRIATGHQADDQAETVLLRIARGTGVRGLAGIPARRGRIVRPLLTFRRSEVEAFLREREITCESDPANLELRWARSRVRHVLLPALSRALERDPVPDLLALAAAADEASRALDASARRLLVGSRTTRPGAMVEEFRRDAWLDAPPPVLGAAVQAWARRRGIRLRRGGTRTAVEFITRGRSGGHVCPCGGLRVSRSFGVLRFEVGPKAQGEVGAGDSALSGPNPDTAAGPIPEEVELRSRAGRGLVRIGGRALRVSWAWGADGAAALSPRRVAATSRVAVSVGPGHFPLRLRSWRPGDRIRQSGGTRKLKKLFGEHRIPRCERDGRPVLVDRSGRVVWVAGLELAEWARPVRGRSELLIEIANA